ncbi:chain length determinant protein EpsF [Roseateles koreensis]|uniref:Chain length determinant protein EpsF n=1 Tax=Roseateles koreensis TaxID=2987526 RepID=A0ABT5KV49_9BURK|nr:chain length determinant protein EpsF [Roseateles koreensis]MDC8786702.1 chain length determinant protein EpsF [Roseateles koreensis]
MTIAQLLSIFRARWRIALATFLTVFLIAVVGTLLATKMYMATASVVVDAKPDPVSLAYSGMSSPGVMATQVDVIKSDRVAMRVVKNLKLAENPQIREQWKQATNGQGSVESWLSESFQKSMEVKPSKESSVIEISYRAPDPRFAAALANAFVQSYIETTLELRVDPARQYSAFFDNRAKEARETYEKAQARLSAFQKDNGLIASEERLDVENNRLVELSSQLVGMQALSAESTSRQTQANSVSADRMQEVLNNPLISGLKSDLSRAEVRLKELNARYGDSHPQVQEAKENIAELRVKVDAEIKRVTGGIGVSNTINKQREAEIRSSLDAQRAKLLHLKATRDEGAVLQRDVENAQRAYDAVQARLNQTSLESQTTTSNVNVLTVATPPLVHATPRTWVNILIGVFAGVILALAVAVTVELFDRRVRTSDDLISAIGLPIIGLMPNPSGRSKIRAQKLGRVQKRILGNAPSAAKSS